MGGCCSCCGDGRPAKRAGLASSEHRAPPLDSYANWKQQLRTDLDAKPLIKTSVASDYPRIARTLFVGEAPDDFTLGGGGSPAVTHFIKQEELPNLRERAARRLCDIALLVGDQAVHDAVQAKWAEYIAEDSFDLAPGMRKIFAECIPEETGTAQVLKCLGQGIVFVPLSRVRYLVHSQRYCTRLQDKGLWKIHIFKDSNGDVVVAHTRTEASDVDAKDRHNFEFTWQFRFVLRGVSGRLSLQEGGDTSTQLTETEESTPTHMDSLQYPPSPSSGAARASGVGVGAVRWEVVDMSLRMGSVKFVKSDREMQQEVTEQIKKSFPEATFERK